MLHMMFECETIRTQKELRTCKHVIQHI